MEVALAAPERVTALWLMGCDPAAPLAGGPDLAGGLEATPDAVFDMLAGLVVHKDAAAQAAVFKAMAKRVDGPAGAAQARALAVRQEAASRLGELTMPTCRDAGICRRWRSRPNQPRYSPNCCRRLRHA